MKKSLICLLALLLLCSAFACKGQEPSPAALTTALPTEASAAGASEPAEGTEDPAQDMRSVSFETEAETIWSEAETWNTLAIYGDGTALLELASENEALWLKENGETFTAQVRMYRTPYDIEPQEGFPVGEVRLLTDGAKIRLSVEADPYGILLDRRVDGVVLQRREGSPYAGGVRWNDEANVQPNASWSQRYYDSDGAQAEGLRWYMEPDLSVTGYYIRKDESYARYFTVLEREESTALFDRQTGELIFYGCDQFLNDSQDYRAQYAKRKIRPIYDPYGFAQNGYLTLYREDETEAMLLLGANVDLLAPRLAADGWTDETATLEALQPGLGEFFTRLTRSGETLLIYHTVHGTPFGPETYVEAYVRYAADGSVLEWSGQQPAGHLHAERFLADEDADFAEELTVRTLNEAPYYFYLLDNGCIAVEDVDAPMDSHADYFRIIRVIP